MAFQVLMNTVKWVQGIDVNQIYSSDINQLV